MSKWVISSAWPYSSDIPHLGNLVGSVLSADVFARFQRLVGSSVVFVSGSDEHGTALEVVALRDNIPIKELVDRNHERISNLFRRWNISYDNYTRTESPVHRKYVSDLYMDIYRNDNYIFTQVERIHYCPNDKRFLPDRFVEGTCPFCSFVGARGDQCDNCGRLIDAEKLISPYCVICKTPTILRETKQWFFDLPKLSDYISGYLDRAELSPNVVNFCRGWIKSGLRPRSITRDSKWGIPAPFPGAEGKTIYVWMDAVLGYVSATIEYFERKGEPDAWKKYWFEAGSKTAYFIGKDNIPFHAVILPSLLYASGSHYNEPSTISSTEFLLFENQKFSKSRKIGIWIDEALEILPVDNWRYALIVQRPESGDVNFGWDVLVEKVNSDLNDNVGNFVNRTLVGVSRFADNSLEVKKEDIAEEFTPTINSIYERHDRVKESYESAGLQAACRLTIEGVANANKFLSSLEPWKVVKTDRARALQILYVALTFLKVSCLELYPIIPGSVDEILKQVTLFKKSGKISSWDEISIDEDLPISTSQVKPLFYKVSAEKLKESLEEIRRRKIEVQTQQN